MTLIWILFFGLLVSLAVTFYFAWRNEKTAKFMIENVDHYLGCSYEQQKKNYNRILFSFKSFKKSNWIK